MTKPASSDQERQLFVGSNDEMCLQSQRRRGRTPQPSRSAMGNVTVTTANAFAVLEDPDPDSPEQSPTSLDGAEEMDE